MNKIPDGTTVELTGTFDGHVHLRQKKTGLLELTLPDLLDEFGGALIMCNTEPPITSIRLGLDYRAEVLSELPAGAEFDALFTYYLTDEAKADEIVEGYRRRIWRACKYMPNNGSTNTARALTRFRNGYPIYERMEEEDIPLLLHAETVGDRIDPFDAPRVFISEEMPELRKRFPKLRVCLEHITDGTAADYMAEAERNNEPTWATLTPQHFVYSRNRIFQRGSVREGTFRRGSNPSFVCWPLLQREEPHRQKLLQQVAGGNNRIGLGTDRAPHDFDKAKACEDGCGGCYPGRLALAIYAMGFEAIGSFEHFQNFACRNIPCGLYRLPPGKKKIRLTKCAARPSTMPEKIGEVVPILHGEKIPWREEAVC
ncbi:MAG: dihydroorotase [Candidatus Taylorbacteria bacterium]|nr:dihydroorotase [Candidatus Taylorbacteria bacterium]